MTPYSDICSVHISEVTDDFPFYHHISAAELKKIFEERGWNWDEYKKFTVVRNPYDRVVSLWHHHQWMYEKKHINYIIPSFEEYVNQIDPANRLTTSLKNFISDEEGNSLVEDVILFE